MLKTRIAALCSVTSSIKFLHVIVNTWPTCRVKGTVDLSQNFIFMIFERSKSTLRRKSISNQSGPVSPFMLPCGCEKHHRNRLPVNQNTKEPVFSTYPWVASVKVSLTYWWLNRGKSQNGRKLSKFRLSNWKWSSFWFENQVQSFNSMEIWINFRLFPWLPSKVVTLMDQRSKESFRIVTDRAV